MPKLRFLCPEIPPIGGTRRDLDGNTLDDLETVPFDSNNLARIIRNQLDLVQPKIRQDLRPNSIVAKVRLEPQPQIGLDGVAAFVLEPVGEEIPTGRYPYRLTVSGRAQRGTLWTPLAEWFPAHPDRWLLPELLDVPGRTAVRSHSGNRAADSDGCLLHGTTRVPDAVVGSRPMLTRVVGLLLWCQAVGEPAWFEVEG